MIDQKLGMRWKCEARADHLDDEICELMAEAGCERVKIGFESGSNRILSQVKKLETREEMLEKLEEFKDMEEKKEVDQNLQKRKATTVLPTTGL